jgi:hypothetical protein
VFFIEKRHEKGIEKHQKTVKKLVVKRPNGYCDRSSYRNKALESPHDRLCVGCI